MARYINIGNGNYNENVEGDYVEGVSITTSYMSDGTVKKTIIEGLTKTVEITKPNGDFSRTVTTISPNGNSVNMNFKNRVNNVVGNLQGNQVIQGNGNQVIQQSGSNIAIGHMDGGHIGDNVTVAGSINQVVQGNGNKVSQTSSAKVDVTRQEALDLIDNILNGSIFNSKKEEPKPPIEDVEDTLPDPWADEQEPQESTDKWSDEAELEDIKREKELDELMDELAKIVDNKAIGATSSQMLKAAEFIHNLIRFQPLLKEYRAENLDGFYEELLSLVKTEPGKRLVNIINNL